MSQTPAILTEREPVRQPGAAAGLEIDWDDVPESEEETGASRSTMTMTGFWSPTRIVEVIRVANRRHVDPKKVFADRQYHEAHETIRFRTVERRQPPKTFLGRVVRSLLAKAQHRVNPAS